jgi:hypothetical protein
MVISICSVNIDYWMRRAITKFPVISTLSAQIQIILEHNVGAHLTFCSHPRPSRLCISLIHLLLLSLMSLFVPAISRNAVNGACIARFPEEILHRILSYSVSVPLAPLLRPSWHIRQKSCNRSRTATLLVCKSWLRIATPLFYKHVLLQSEEQAALLSYTLTANPILGRYAQSLRVMGVWGVLRDVIKLCSSVESLDLTLDAPRIVDTDCRMKEIGKALSDLELLDIRHFVLRKLPNAYITQHKPRFVISHLSLIVPRWQRLVSALTPVIFLHRPQPCFLL